MSYTPETRTRLEAELSDAYGPLPALATTVEVDAADLGDTLAYIDKLEGALERIKELPWRTPVGAGDGGTFVLTGQEGIEAAKIARSILSGEGLG